MIRKKTLAFALAGAFAIGGGGVLYAQNSQDGMGMTGMMGNCPMMQAAAEGPAAILQHSDTLNLTAEQTARLESLRDEMAEGRQSSMAAMREVHREITQAGMGEVFDEVAVRNAFSRMGDLHAKMGVAMLEARHEALQVLVGSQRETFAAIRAGAAGGAMNGMMEMMKNCPMMQGMGGMMEMMRNCPMMQGGMAPGSGAGMMDVGQEGAR